MYWRLPPVSNRCIVHGEMDRDFPRLSIELMMGVGAINGIGIWEGMGETKGQWFQCLWWGGFVFYGTKYSFCKAVVGVT